MRVRTSASACEMRARTFAAVMANATPSTCTPCAVPATHPLLGNHVTAPLEDEDGIAAHADGHWQQDEGNDLHQVGRQASLQQQQQQHREQQRQYITLQCRRCYRILGWLCGSMQNAPQQSQVQ